MEGSNKESEAMKTVRIEENPLQFSVLDQGDVSFVRGPTDLPIAPNEQRSTQSKR